MSESDRDSFVKQSRHTFDVSRRIYRDTWSILVSWFRVPKKPPEIPRTASQREPEVFQPADGYLRYLKFWFWIVLVLVDLAILIGWITLFVLVPVAGVILALPALLLAIVPDIIAYVAIHLRYDTMWYVLSDRSLRIRRGIWIVHETTITYENVQNLSIRQGPLQRCFGIADVVVETAGGGSRDSTKGQGSSPFAVANQGILEGVADAERWRDLILARVRASTSAGLGDELERPTSRDPHEPKPGTSGLSKDHIDVLREIRDSIERINGVAGR